MSKSLLVSLTAVVLVVSAGAVGFASAKAERAERALEVQTRSSAAELDALRGALEQQVRRGPVKCQTLRCVNRTLSSLSNGFIAVADLALALAHEVIDCQALVNVTKYFGYEYDDGAGGTVLTTALDETEIGDIPSARVLAYTC